LATMRNPDIPVRAEHTAVCGRLLLTAVPIEAHDEQPWSRCLMKFDKQNR